MLRIDKHAIVSVLRNAGHDRTEVARRTAILSVIGEHALGDRLQIVAQALDAWGAKARRLDEAEGASAAWMRGETINVSPELERAEVERQHYQAEYDQIVARIVALAGRIEDEAIAEDPAEYSRYAESQVIS